MLLHRLNTPQLFRTYIQLLLVRRQHEGNLKSLTLLPQIEHRLQPKIRWIELNLHKPRSLIEVVQRHLITLQLRLIIYQLILILLLFYYRILNLHTCRLQSQISPCNLVPLLLEPFRTASSKHLLISRRKIQTALQLIQIFRNQLDNEGPKIRKNLSRKVLKSKRKTKQKKVSAKNNFLHVPTHLLHLFINQREKPPEQTRIFPT